MIEICFNESFYFFFFFTSVTFIASHSRLSIELKKSYLSPLFRFFKEVNSRGSVDKRQVSFSRVARVISVGTRLYRSTYVQDACELEKLVEQGKRGKRMHCVSIVSRNGCKFIYSYICFGNGRGRISLSYLTSSLIYIYRSIKKKNWIIIRLIS